MFVSRIIGHSNKKQLWYVLVLLLIKNKYRRVNYIMNKDDFKQLDREQMIVAFNQLKDDYHQLSLDKEQRDIEYAQLVKASEQIAFNERNNYTEDLLRCLLKQGNIELINGMYHRKDFDYEKENNITIVGEMKVREKVFYLDEDSLDEYTMQLEHQLKEYTEAKEIFKKYNYKNETLFEHIKRLDSELGEAKDIIDRLSK